MSKNEIIDNYIAEELMFVNAETDIDKHKELALELDIRTDKLKEKIIELLNNKIETLSNEQITLYYSIYLYFKKQDEKQTQVLLDGQKEEEINRNFQNAKKCIFKKQSNNCEELLCLLDKKQLSKLIHHIFYYNYELSGIFSIDEFFGLITKINKKIIIDIIVSNDTKKLFNGNNLALGKNFIIKFLENVDYKDYLKFKNLIFTKKYKKDKFYYIILKYFIKYFKTEKYNSLKRKSIEDEFDSYFLALKNDKKGKTPKKNRR